ncbi:MAG: endo-1,4-beta-xylanase [Treponema sp.]|jgi:endo-1,4-beta-xylanase|nr:endo-1,4-beta-xylanase [Treponema sp.]
MKIKIFVFLLPILLVFNVTNCGTSGSSNTRQTQPLKTIYKDYFLIGNIITPSYLRGEYLDLLTTHYNTVTCENQMKPDALAPAIRGGQYNWAQADNMLNEMAANDILVHGHTLVWHNQTPSWMTEGTAAQVRQNMINHINTVLSHYKGRIFSWDVVNEAVKERINPGENYEDWRNQLRTESGWFKALGADYVELAFRTARAADPDVMLYYNDYNLNNQRKAQVTAAMIEEINNRYKAEGNSRNLIDAIGLQAHYGLTVRIDDVRNTIERFAGLGLKVDISELDVEVRSVGGSSFGTRKDSRLLDTEARQQALVYAQLFNLFKEYKDHITRVTMWGMDDESSWKSMGNPCLFDGDLNPKQAFFAVVDPNRTLRL